MFTNLGKIGPKGPNSIGSHYKDQDHEGQVKLFSGIQLWTVPRTGEYRIEAIGASGGYGKDSVIKTGGRGARMIGNFILTKDEIIHVLVGQKGKRGLSNSNTAGGGGGTFVVRENNISLIIAGGGGGIKNMSEQDPGCDASINTTANAGNNSPLGSGGSNGNGGKGSGQSAGKRRKKIEKQSVCSIHQDRKITVRLVNTELLKLLILTLKFFSSGRNLLEYLKFNWVSPVQFLKFVHIYLLLTIDPSIYIRITSFTFLLS